MMMSMLSEADYVQREGHYVVTIHRGMLTDVVSIWWYPQEPPRVIEFTRVRKQHTDEVLQSCLTRVRKMDNLWD